MSQIQVVRDIFRQIAISLDRERHGDIYLWSVWPFDPTFLGFSCLRTRNAHLRVVTTRGAMTPFVAAHVLLHEAVHVLMQPNPPIQIKPDTEVVKVQPNGTIHPAELAEKFDLNADSDPLFKVCCAIASVRLFGQPLPDDYAHQWPINAPGSGPLLHDIARRLAPHAITEIEDATSSQYVH